MMSKGNVALELARITDILNIKYGDPKSWNQEDRDYKRMVRLRQQIVRKTAKQERIIRKNRPRAPKRIKPKEIKKPIGVDKYRIIASESKNSLDKFVRKCRPLSLSDCLIIICQLDLAVEPKFGYCLESVDESKPNFYGTRKDALMAAMVNKAGSTWVNPHQLELLGYKLKQGQYYWEDVAIGSCYLLEKNRFFRVKTSADFSTDLKAYEPVVLSMLNYFFRTEYYQGLQVK